MATTAIGDIIASTWDNIMDAATDWLKEHAKELTWAGIGAALNTPTGHAFLKELAKMCGGLAATVAKGSKNLILKTFAQAAKGKLGQSALVESGVGKAGAVAGASVLAGYMVGSTIGYTITEENKVMKVIRMAYPQIFTVTDSIRNAVESAKGTLAKYKETLKPRSKEEVAKEVDIARALNVNTEANNLGVDLENLASRAAAAKMTTPPSDPQGFNEWMKALERREREQDRGGQENMGKNHPDWYKSGKYNAIQYSGEYNFDLKNGDPSRTPLPAYVSGTVNTSTGLPTIARLKLILTLGHVYNDLLENTFLDVTNKVKAINKNGSLTSTWNKLDLIKLIHTMRVIYAAWLVGTRAYKLINQFETSDLTTPYVYFAAMGLDYDDWQINRSQIQEDLKNIASRMSIYIDFSKLDLFNRTKQLFDNGYMDGKTSKAQKTIFTLSQETKYFNFSTGSWVDMVAGDGTMISATVTGQSYLSWKTNILNAMNSLLNVGKVQDMLSCLRYVLGVGDNGMFVIPNNGDKFNFVYEDEVMSQIENAVIQQTSSVQVYSIADNAAGDWYVEGITGNTRYCDKRFFNSHKNKMSKDDQIVSTRLQVAYLTAPGSSTPEFFYGTEVANEYDIVAITMDSSFIKKIRLFDYYDKQGFNFAATGTTPAATRPLALNLVKLGLIATMDWAPMMDFVFTCGTSTTTAATVDVVGTVNADWANYGMAFDTSVNASLTWMSYMRNGNYSLFSKFQSQIDAALDKAKRA